MVHLLCLCLSVSPWYLDISRKWWGCDSGFRQLIAKFCDMLDESRGPTVGSLMDLSNGLIHSSYPISRSQRDPCGQENGKEGDEATERVEQGFIVKEVHEHLLSLGHHGPIEHRTGIADDDAECEHLRGLGHAGSPNRYRRRRRPRT